MTTIKFSLKDASKGRAGLQVKLTLSIILLTSLISTGQGLVLSNIQMFDFSAQVIQVVSIIASIIFSSVGAYLIIRLFIKKPMVALKDFAQNLAKNDFSKKVEIKTGDEFELLGVVFNESSNLVSTLIKEINSLADKVNESTMSLASSTEEINASFEEVAALSNDFSNNATNVSENAQLMNEAGTKISLRSKESYNTVSNAEIQMQQISDKVKDLKGSIISLEDHAQNINSITNTIKDITDQTNLLSLNAAIEAARAGEHGRGFGVVAEEIRKLADQSSNSAFEIANLISNIQLETKEVAKTIDVSVAEVESGIESITSMGTDLKSIIKNIEEIVAQIGDVTKASELIGAGSQEVSAAVQEQTATMQEVASMTTSLQNMVHELTSMLSGFKY